MLKYVSDRMTMDWEDKYGYAKVYYEHHGHLEIPERFKTNNGYEHDNEGIINLGAWIKTQRINVDPEKDVERYKLLSEIGMRWGKLERLSWEDKYGYAKAYYEHHGNLEIPERFTTNNGYEHDDKGTIYLGTWIMNQRNNIDPEKDVERYKLLTEIGMRWKVKNYHKWEEMYGYAKAYYEHHGNLEIPEQFTTNNGYEHDDKGTIKLGTWIRTQRSKVDREKDIKRYKLLSEIGMRWSERKTWEEMYGYAKAYYEHHGNLEIPERFTTNNGYDDKGTINLGTWIRTQRNNIDPEKDIERYKLLSEIGMRWEKIK